MAAVARRLLAVVWLQGRAVPWRTIARSWMRPQASRQTGGWLLSCSLQVGVEEALAVLARRRLAMARRRRALAMTAVRT